MRKNSVIISFSALLCFAVNPHILHPDPSPLWRRARRTADRRPNIPERLLFSSLNSTMGSAELANGAGQQHGPGRRGRASQPLLRCTDGPQDQRRGRGRPPQRALPDHRYKTEAPGSLKALREAGGRHVSPPRSSFRVPD